jgi:hypothetical protein
MVWVPTYDGEELPSIKSVEMLARMQAEPSEKNDRSWSEALIGPDLLAASNSAEIRESLLSLWRVKMAEDETVGPIWKRHAAVWIVSRLCLSLMISLICSSTATPLRRLPHQQDYSFYGRRKVAGSVGQGREASSWLETCSSEEAGSEGSNDYF